jgi:oligopeptide/dipeptide ABC transporter ATP-binding protein
MIETATNSQSLPAVPRLRVDGLKTYFFLDHGILKAVDGVDFWVGEGESVGIIGESGCGKSITAQSMLQLVRGRGQIVAGHAVLRRKDGSTTDILSLDPDSDEMRSVRGDEASIIFQEPMTSFSPVHTIGFQIGEVLKLHTSLSQKDIRTRVVEMLDRVGISNPDLRFDEYPHQLSGGMRQRAMIAMALICNPQIVIADEPTTALDVTIQAQILDLMRDLQLELGMSIVYITHNMAVVAENVSRVYVMYLGRVVETTTTDRLFNNPQHPYTQKLLQSIPHPGRPVERLEVIEGSVPSAVDSPRRCGFFTRCERAMPGVCDVAVPALSQVNDEHWARCFLLSEEREADDEWSGL